MHSDDQTIDCVFTEPTEPGVYTLVVSCRNGARETLAPAAARVKVHFVDNLVGVGVHFK